MLPYKDQDKVCLPCVTELEPTHQPMCRARVMSTCVYMRPMVATCVSCVCVCVYTQGLDFPAIQHVINYDMPDEIENYVHRIGRTGRCGKTGVATTFVNTRHTNETILLDLKHLLKEAKQVRVCLWCLVCLCVFACVRVWEPCAPLLHTVFSLIAEDWDQLHAPLRRSRLC